MHAARDDPPLDAHLSNLPAGSHASDANQLQTVMVWEALSGKKLPSIRSVMAAEAC